MRFAREPRLIPVAIHDLRPTQITLGMAEVAEKRAQWQAHGADKKAEFLGNHLIPVVLGPKRRHHLIDHHHLARALHDEGVAEVAVTIVADLSMLDPAAFYVYLDNRGLSHLYDEHGRRQDHRKLPKHVGAMPDDPYRSLAGALRRAGGYAKDTTPFSEFLWADFLRRRIKPKIAREEPAAALAKALRLAKSEAAAYLPGWCGPLA